MEHWRAEKEPTRFNNESSRFSKCPGNHATAGAGDDEENWARGLHPRHVWAARDTLLRLPPHQLNHFLAALAAQQAETPTEVLRDFAEHVLAMLLQ